LLDQGGFFNDNKDMPSFLTRNFFKDKIILIMTLSALVLNVAVWAYLLWQIGDTKTMRPLHYNIYFGIDWYGPGWKLYIYPVFALIITIADYVLAFFWYNQQKLFSYLILAFAVLINFSMLVAAALAIAINGI
jgi:hypothetical protein